jgi:hypothetical protein
MKVAKQDSIRGMAGPSEWGEDISRKAGMFHRVSDEIVEDGALDSPNGSLVLGGLL